MRIVNILSPSVFLEKGMILSFLYEQDVALLRGALIEHFLSFNAKLFQMKSALLKEAWLEVSQQEAADTLVDVKKRRYLEPFIRKTCTLQEAANELNVKPNTMHYQVQRLLRLGLLEMTAIKKRKGMASKLYRSSATRFFVALKDTSVSSREDLLFNLEVQSLQTIIRRTLQLRAAQHEDWGLAFSLAEDGKIEIQFVSKDQKEATWPISNSLPFSLMNDYLTVQLSEVDAKEIFHMLNGIAQKISKKESAEGRHYLVHLAMVPLED